MLDEHNEVLYTIRGFHYCACYCCEDIDIAILDRDGSTPTGGNIRKAWRGCCADIMEKDAFIFTMPSDADVMKRVVLMGALFAVDFLYFEYDRA